MGLCLAFIGSINDEILDKEELAAELIKNMSGRYGKRLEERYGVTLVENTAGDGEDTKKPGKFCVKSQGHVPVF